VPGHFILSFVTAVLCGAISVCAFAPFGWWPVVVVALAVFFTLLYETTGRWRVTWLGYGFGLGLFGAGVHWVYFSLHLFGDAIAPVAALGTLLFVMLLAIIPALFARMVSAQSPLRSAVFWRGGAVSWFLLFVPALWLLIEWMRSWLFTGFPWLSIGYTTLNNPLSGYGPIGGVFLSSWLLAISAGCIGLCLAQRRARSFIVAIPVLLAIWLGGWLLQQQQWTEPHGDPVTVTMVQGNVAQEIKFRHDLLQQSLRTYSDHSLGGAELIIWPETAVPTFFSDVQGYLDDFAAAVGRNGSTIVSGGFLTNEAQTEYYNAIRVLGGSDDQVYTKRHLVPFGEFIPFRNVLTLLADLIMIPMSDLSPGRGPIVPIEINAVHYAMSICYEDAFGAEVRQQLPTANVLINISNDAWFGDSIAPHQHQEMAAMRSLETGRPMLRATNTGITAMISERGQIVATAPQFQTAALDVTVQPRAGSTPYVRFGDMPVVILALVMVLLFFVVKFAAGPSRQQSA